jgi:urease accessory protein
MDGSGMIAGHQRGVGGVLAGLALLLSPSRAAAHLVTTGMGPVYDGIGYLLLTPEDLVPVVALALLAGLRGATHGRRALFLLPVAWLVGGFLGLPANASPAFPVSALSFLILGALVAADVRLPAYAFAILAIVLGLVHGAMNGAALQGGAGSLGMLGITAALFVLVALASAFVVSLERPWSRIAVRVAGSWVCAIGLLMLGWLVKGQM